VTLSHFSAPFLCSLARITDLQSQLQQALMAKSSTEIDMRRKNDEVERMSEELCFLRETIRSKDEDLHADQAQFDKVCQTLTVEKEALEVAKKNMHLKLQTAHSEGQRLREDALRRQDEYAASVAESDANLSEISFVVDEKVAEIGSLICQLRAAQDNEQNSVAKSKNTFELLSKREDECNFKIEAMRQKMMSFGNAAEDEVKQRVLLLESRAERAEARQFEAEEALKNVSERAVSDRLQYNENLIAERGRVLGQCRDEHNSSIESLTSRLTQLDELRNAQDVRLQAFSTDVISIKHSHASELKEAQQTVSSIQQDLERALQDARDEREKSARLHNDLGEVS
jgi:hypothetical protein